VLHHGPVEWRRVTSLHGKPAAKIDDLKFFECPGSAITRSTWQILALVNETTDREGNILHLPYPGTILDQPPWYREAVRIVASERNSTWFRAEAKEAAKREAGKNG